MLVYETGPDVTTLYPGPYTSPSLYKLLRTIDEAKNILRFYHDIWEKTGELHCAQGIGVDGIFHIHEKSKKQGYLSLKGKAY